jgi:hypothetical protein
MSKARDPQPHMGCGRLHRHRHSTRESTLGRILPRLRLQIVEIGRGALRLRCCLHDEALVICKHLQP